MEGLGIYTQDVTEHTYRHLLELARQILHSGYPVIVDAAFLQQQERRQFGELAQALSVPFIILSIHSKDEIQRQRIQHRQTTRRDASEADVVIYERLKIAAEALTDEEREFTLTVSNNHALDQVGADPALWTKLAQLLGRNRYVAETL